MTCSFSNRRVPCIVGWGVPFNSLYYVDWWFPVIILQKLTSQHVSRGWDFSLVRNAKFFFQLSESIGDSMLKENSRQGPFGSLQPALRMNGFSK